jgi:hypothetical protein
MAVGVLVVLIEAAYVLAVTQVHGVPFADWVVYLMHGGLIVVVAWQVQVLSKAKSKWGIVVT